MLFELKMEVFITGGTPAGSLEKVFEDTDRVEAIKHMLERVRWHQDNNKDIKDLQIKAELREKETGILVSTYADF